MQTFVGASGEHTRRRLFGSQCFVFHGIDGKVDHWNLRSKNMMNTIVVQGIPLCTQDGEEDECMRSSTSLHRELADLRRTPSSSSLSCECPPQKTGPSACCKLHTLEELGDDTGHLTAHQRDMRDCRTEESSSILLLCSGLLLPVNGEVLIWSLVVWPTSTSCLLQIFLTKCWMAHCGGIYQTIMSSAFSKLQEGRNACNPWMCHE